MKKRSHFWIMIGIGVGIVVLLMVISSVISVGERLRSVHPYVEYGFYGLSALLFYILIVNPLRIILFAPSFSITTVMESDPKKYGPIYRRIARNVIENNEISPEEKEMLETHMHQKEELKSQLNHLFDTSIKKEINKIILKNATTVMISTAISQNGRLDMLTVLTVNLRMIKDIVLKCGFRPSYTKLGKLSVQVVTTALIAESLEGLDFNDLFPQSTANFLAEVPLIKPIASSIIQGMSNALLTLRIGAVTRRYLFSETKDPSKAAIRREAIKESIQMIPIVIKDVLTFFPSKIVKLFSKKPDEKPEMEGI
ncbi:MAG: YcjF family protein [Bacilli bacterium]|jgi:hypothetical protein|nr:YcjF family protein [Bacilli bacterium]MDY0063586.1 YcjF family protein [Bacilli bacterium]